MRLLASGDHHFDQHSRFEECLAIHAWMVDLAREQKTDVFLSGGDVFDRASTPMERQAVADWLTDMAGVCPVVVAKGNHDRPLDVALMRRLKTRHPVIVEERARVHHVAGAAIATVAWPERSNLVASLMNSALVDAGMREGLQAVLRGLGLQLEAHEGPRILLGHFMVDGSVTSTGQPLLGMPINVGLADLGLARASLTLMGHIHCAQRFELETGPAHYTGSPFRTDYGQLEKKTVLLAEFRGADLVDVTEVETPCTPMVHITAVYQVGSLIWEMAEVRGAEVRLRYSVDAEHREAARNVAASVADTLRCERGAKAVKVEEVVIATKRARAPEVARAVSIADKLDAHWHAIGLDPTAEYREALHTRAREIELEVASCV
jgi:DNA repair protein SbcD/Mre11